MGGHGFKLVNGRTKVHLREDVTLQINAGCYLDQLKSAFAQPEDTTLRDIEHRLSTLPGIRAAERSVLHFTHELSRASILEDAQRAVLHGKAKLARIERSNKDHLLAFWLMLMKPPAPASFVPNRLTFRLPSRSACARPRNATSRPPPS